MLTAMKKGKVDEQHGSVTGKPKVKAERKAPPPLGGARRFKRCIVSPRNIILEA